MAVARLRDASRLPAPPWRGTPRGPLERSQGSLVTFPGAPPASCQRWDIIILGAPEETGAWSSARATAWARQTKQFVAGYKFRFRRRRKAAQGPATARHGPATALYSYTRTAPSQIGEAAAQGIRNAAATLLASVILPLPTSPRAPFLPFQPSRLGSALTGKRDGLPTLRALCFLPRCVVPSVATWRMSFQPPNGALVCCLLPPLHASTTTSSLSAGKAKVISTRFLQQYRKSNDRRFFTSVHCCQGYKLLRARGSGRRQKPSPLSELARNPKS